MGNKKPLLIQPSKKSIYGSGYSEAKKKKLENVQVPSQTRCRGCKRLKNISQFSNKQLMDLRNYLAMGNTITEWGMLIDCRQCTGVQIHEMTCAICDETKGLDGFSKAQRHNPDNARCLLCVDEHLAVDPTIGDGDLSGDEDEDDEGTTSDGVTNQYAFSDLDDDSLGGANLDETGLAAHDQSMNEMENTPGGGNQNSGMEYAAHKAQGTSYIGFDPHGDAHNLTQDSFTDVCNRSFRKTAPKDLNSVIGKSSDAGKFAKVKAERPAPAQSLRSSIAASAKGRQVKYDTDESDDDWGIIP